MSPVLPDALAALLNVPAATPSSHVREDRLRIRVLPEEMARWRNAAEDAGASSLSGWLRDLADEAALTGRDPQAWRKTAMELQRDLSGMANNLNQIAKHLNTMRKGGKSTGAGEAASVLKMSADVENTIHLLQKLLSGKGITRRTRTRVQNNPANADTSVIGA